MVTLRSTVTTTDSDGNSTTVPTEIEWGPCAVAPRSSVERVDPRSPAVLTGKTVYGPVVDMDADDQLVINGVVYDIDGEPGEWINPMTGWVAGLEVAIKRTGSV